MAPVFAAALLAVAPSFAGTITVQSPYNSWDGNTANIDQPTTIDFTCTSGSCTSYTQYPTYTSNTGGATFTGSAALNFVGLYWVNHSDGGGMLMGGNTNGTTPSAVTVTLPSNVTAINVGLGLQGASSGLVTVSSGGQVIGTASLTSSSPINFFGITSTSSLGTLTFSTVNGNLLVDNVTFGAMQSVSNPGGGTTSDPTATPEGASLLLAGSGLAFLAMSQRLRKRTAA